jgi:hypothetical protein
MINKILYNLKVRLFLYRYNIKRRNKDGTYKDIYEALKEMESVYRRLPKEEQIIMRNKIQSIINNYRKE